MTGPLPPGFLTPHPHRPTDLPFWLWGRRAKPQAVATVLGLIGVMIGPLNPGDAAEIFDFDDWPGLAMSAAAAAVLLLLTVGWWRQSRRLLLAGLFWAVWVFASRAALAALSVGVGHPATWFSAGFTVGVGWAWLMERAAARSHE